MATDMRKVVDAIEKLKQSEAQHQANESDTGEQLDSFDSDVEPLIQELADQVLKSHDVESITGWLTVQSMLIDREEESFAEVTQRLNNKYPDEVRTAIPMLNSEQQKVISHLIEDLSEAGEPGTEEAGEGTTEEREAGDSDAGAAPTSAPVGPGRAEFLGKRVFRSTRGFPVIQGTFTLFDRAGSALGSFAVNSGGGASSFRKRNGPVPPGTYRVSNFMVRTKRGMVLNGVGYSFNLDPQPGTIVFGRSLFRIHPDGLSPGTNGCLGVRESASRLSRCKDQIRQLMRDGRMTVDVDYLGLPIS